jgi:hypothetical protein
VIFDEFRFILPTRELLRIGKEGLIDSASPRITRCGNPVSPRRHGEVVSKNEIMNAVWPHMAIQENNPNRPDIGASPRAR